MEGVRFFHEVHNQYRTSYEQGDKQLLVSSTRHGGYQSDSGNIRRIAYKAIIDELENPNTKRILFDSRQAMIFSETLARPENNIQSKLRFPFETFYMEFTEPIRLSQEPGFNDLTRAFMVEGDRFNYKWPNIHEGKLSHMTVFQTAYVNDQITYVDRTFKFDLEKGWAMVPLRLLKETGAIFPELIGGYQLEWGEDDYWPVGMRFQENDNGFNIVRAKPELLSWYERAIEQETTLLYWCLAYMMAKSIVFVEEQEPRAERRRQQRLKIIPRPWHVVKIDPKIIINREETTEQIGTHHSYRYDVIGHLRFGHHPRKDGSYSDTIEWVPGHQRGLQHSLYIPKTYLAEKGRRIGSRPMQEYFGGKVD